MSVTGERSIWNLCTILRKPNTLILNFTQYQYFYVLIQIGKNVDGTKHFRFIGFCMFFVHFENNYTLKLVSTLLTEMVFFAPFIVAIVTSSVLLYTLKKRNKYIGLEAKNETKRSAVIVIIRVTILTLICVTPQLAFSIYTKCNKEYNLHW